MVKLRHGVLGGMSNLVRKPPKQRKPVQPKKKPAKKPAPKPQPIVPEDIEVVEVVEVPNEPIVEETPLEDHLQDPFEQKQVFLYC